MLTLVALYPKNKEQWSRYQDLGPLLFFLYINRLPITIQNLSCLMFDDGVKIFRTVHDRIDCTLRQEDIKNFVDWRHRNKLLRFNISTCSALSITRKRNLVQLQYKVARIPLNRVQCKDLGIIFVEICVTKLNWTCVIV